MFTVALVGPDGTGKSTLAARLSEELIIPNRILYMGVSFESSTQLLPASRLVRWVRGHRSTPHGNGEPSAVNRHGRLAGLRAVLRLSNLLAEEWYRQLLAFYHLRQGRLVIFDRHFAIDYRYASAGRGPGRSSRRLHLAILRRLYPRPDLVIVLDAPIEVLAARRDDPIEVLARKRAEYLRTAAREGFRVVATDQPLHAVVAEVRAAVEAEARRRER
jgi:thymidylate kinase